MKAPITATFVRRYADGSPEMQLSDGRTAILDPNRGWLVSFTTSGGYGIGYRRASAAIAAMLEEVAP